MMRFEKLDEMERMPQILALEKSQMGSAGKILYQKIGPTLDSKWTAVFTALGEDGEWHAYAVREGLLVEFPPVPKR